MQITKENFVKQLKRVLSERLALDLENATPEAIYRALSTMITDSYSNDWRKTQDRYHNGNVKQVYYFSIEFLPGDLLKSNLLNMGWLKVVKEAFKDLKIDFNKVANVEPDMALGNGGLGRLAAAIMDSMASLALPGYGVGIRYKYGMFDQKFINGYQTELPNEWLINQNSWEVRRESASVLVRFGGSVNLIKGSNGKLVPKYHGSRYVQAVPYDTGIVGYRNGCVNTMRLWSAEIPPFEAVNYPTIDSRRKVEDLTSVLYPDDSTQKGRNLRLEQEYFFVSAGCQDIVRDYCKYHHDIYKIADYVAIHINDTHPSLCIAEFMRILLDDEGLDWDSAWKITQKVMSFTNHTILQESLEKWPVKMMAEIEPRILQIIEEINRRFCSSLAGKYNDSFIQNVSIISNGIIRMANLAVVGSHSINGVSKLHTQLLKSKVLHNFDVIFPGKFNNKTNGIAIRRWLRLANPRLTELIDGKIDKEWHEDANALNKLLKYQNDKKFLQRVNEVKLENKNQLASFIKHQTGIKVSPSAIFDVQIKRLHAYKRQLLNLMRIIKLYQDIKENPKIDIEPRVFIFGAKAAPSYHYAKSIIKCINETAKLINNDPVVSRKIQVIFLENYDVSLAERIIPAADVSEQISTTTKEASGTSNMKLMLNGALTVATMDGANIEIANSVGKDNIFTFGLSADEVYKYYQNHTYCSFNYYRSDPAIKRVLDAFIDGTIPNIVNEGHEIFESLTKYNDEYFVLRDFESYINIQGKVDVAYRDRLSWARKSLINIANAGIFSADRMVTEYANDIWHVKAVVNRDDSHEYSI